MVNPETICEESRLQRQRLRVPRTDQSLLAILPLPDALHCAESNHDFLHSSQVNIQGRTIEQMRAWSRDALFAEASRYTSELTGQSVEAGSADLVFVGGHQPSLFHPGVWVKNFAIAELATRTGGASINLVIDNDTISTSQIRVPAGTREHPSIESIPFDDPLRAQPWEEVGVRNPELFRSFDRRVGEALARWNIEPIILDLWPEALRVLDANPESVSLRDCLTAVRVRAERAFGYENLELPISRLCTADPFLWFTGHLLAQLPRFREIYNQALAEYRHENKIRSRTHPVPELKQQGDWLEAPFWIWRRGDQQRARLFARQVGREVELFDGREVFQKLRLAPDMDACCAVEALRELPERGIRLRTRALTTTLFARLCLADLFIHGIGGAKYDEMTDRIIERFFGMRAPAFGTMSATLHLPLAEPFNASEQDVARLRKMDRELIYSADRHVNVQGRPDVAELVAEKQSLIAQQQTRRSTGLTYRQRRAMSRENFELYRRLQGINQQLQEHVAPQRRALESELEITREQLEANAVLQDREFSIAIYPESTLRPFMTTLWDR